MAKRKTVLWEIMEQKAAKQEKADRQMLEKEETKRQALCRNPRKMPVSKQKILERKAAKQEQANQQIFKQKETKRRALCRIP